MLFRSTEAVDEPSFDRNEPSLAQHEDAEGDLDSGATPMKFVVKRRDEERPAVLEIGDHDHAADTGQ